MLQVAGFVAIPQLKETLQTNGWNLKNHTKKPPVLGSMLIFRSVHHLVEDNIRSMVKSMDSQILEGLYVSF